MRKGYEKQILNHHVEKFCLIIRDDIDMFSSTKTLTEVDKNAALQKALWKTSNRILGKKSI